MTPPTLSGWPRSASIAAAVVIAGAGLLWRRPELNLPWGVAKYGGSALWGAMIFFCVAVVINRARLRFVAVGAAIVSALVEASQLLSYEPLDQFRRGAIGALLLGRTFTWWDIAAYWAGIALAWFAAISLRNAVNR